MDDENMTIPLFNAQETALVVTVISILSDAFVFIPLLVYMAEEGIIKEENLRLFAAGLMIFQIVTVAILWIRAVIKDRKVRKWINEEK